MTDLFSTLVPPFFVMVGVLVPAYLLHIREMGKLRTQINQHKLRGNVLDKILDLVLLNDIKTATDTIFKETKADRFLILIAINGKVDFNTVSVIFERHKNSTSSAIARYRNLQVDAEYRAMLKESERNNYLIVETSAMRECLLKDIYTLEGVNHSEIRHLARQPLDKDNDCLVYSSIATHKTPKFTRLELTTIQTQIDSVIKPTIQKMLN